MENMIIHRAESRGYANHGWLDTHHTFSFAAYYNPERMHFGVLRVLNDDIVDGGMGFGTHPHDNMEIVSIPLHGDLEHKDSMGNTTVIKQGDVQIMSAGTGIYHSEYNHNKDMPVNFLQIWVFPNQKGLPPRYDQQTFDVNDRINKFQQIVSPAGEKDGIDIHQDAWFSMANFKKDFKVDYNLRKSGNGIYVFVLEGELTLNGEVLKKRDGAGITNMNSINIKAGTDSEFLLMEVPMN